MPVDLPLKGAMQEPQETQSFAPQVQQQYPQELGTNPIVQQGYSALQQARQGLQTQAQNQPNFSNIQNLIDMAAMLKKAAPSNEEFEKHKQNVVATQAKVDALRLKGQAMMAERHPARNALIRIGGMLGPLGAMAMSQMTGASGEHRELMEAARDIINQKAQLKTSQDTEKEDTAHIKDYIAAQKDVMAANEAYNNSGAKVWSEMGALAPHYLPFAEAPGEMALTKARTTEAQSNADINAYLQSKGIAPLKFQHQQLVNQGEELGIENKKLENKKLNQDLSKPPKQELTPAQHIQIHQLDGSLNDSRATYKTAEGRYNGMLSVIAKAKAPKTQQEIDDLAANKAQLAVFKEQMDHASDTIKSIKHMQKAIVTPVQGHGPMTKPPAVGNPHVTLDEEGNSAALSPAPAPTVYKFPDGKWNIKALSDLHKQALSGDAELRALYNRLRAEIEADAKESGKKNSNVGVEPKSDLLQQALTKYPGLRSLNPAAVTNLNAQPGVLESWPAGETGTSGNLRPKELPINQMGVQILSPHTTPDDIAADLTSHFLVNHDPKISKLYQAFKTSLTPSQKEFLKEDYLNEVHKYGEKGKFDEWLERVGTPSALRGYMFNQYSAKGQQEFGYSEKQKELLDKIKQYIQEK